jgi:hypothetical protein
MIGSRLHGVLDYATAATLLLVSRLPGLRGRLAGRVLLLAGVKTVLYSAVTDYELGVWRKVPYPAHLAIDAAAGSSLAAIGIAAGGRDRAVLVGTGLFELTVTALSDPAG